MIPLAGLIADIWADPYCHVEGRCEDHPYGSVDCLACQIRVVARWDTELARRLLCLHADYSRANLHLLLRHMTRTGIEHHWNETIATIRQAVVDNCPFDPDLSTLEE